tara:strand:- start:3275 stop:5401 length:2127 start_codon:yes stop_codon:yes gene_type:complete
MAYKFQLGKAQLSGALVQEGAIKVLTDAGTEVANFSQAGVISGSGAGQFGGALQSAGSVTAATSFIIGSADLNEADLEKLDGITDGTVAANKAVVVDGNKDANGFRNIDGAGDLTMGTITMSGFSVDADGDLSGKSLISTSTISGSGAISGASFAADGAAVLGGSVTAGTSFIIGSADLNEADLEKLDGITNGTVAASKAVVVDANKDADGFRNLSGSTLLEFGAATLGTDLTVGADVIMAQGGSVYLAGDGGAAKIVSNGGNSVSVFGAKMTVNGSSIEPDADNTTDLGAVGSEFKDLYLDGVAYIDDLRADALGAALNCASQAMTNINVDSGAIDGAIIGANSQAAAEFTTLSASSTLQVGGTVRLDGVADAALSVASDSFYFLDDTDSLVKADSMADYATAIAGDALAASAGVLAVQVSGALKVASDKIGLSGSFAAGGLAYVGGVDSISALKLDISEFSDVQVASGDKFLLLDSDGSTQQLESVDDLASFFAGTGIKAASGVMSLDLNELSDAAIASGDKLAMLDATDSSSKLESIDDIATLFAGNGLSAASAVLALDLNELTAASVNVAADSIALIDADDSNATKKESIADLVTAMAGAGLTATNGVLSTQSGVVTLVADSGTLAEGYNYLADLSADATVTLPASPDVGDVVHVKAGSLSGNNVIISRAGSQVIDDDETSIRIESDFGAVSLVYVVSDEWRIV